MKGKANIFLGNIGSFRASVTKSLNPRASFFARKLDMHQPLLSSQEKDEGVQNLCDSLPVGEGIIYRGTEGYDEIDDAMRSGFLGKDFKESKKDASYDIVAFIRENHSKYFLSFSPCSQTVKPYAAGLSVIPCKGFIWVTGLPKVYTLPQKLLHLNRGMFLEYDRRKREEQDPETPTRYYPITDMTANNNEVTVILGGPNNDWRQDVTRDVMKLIQVAGPGNILGKFMSSNEVVHVKDWTNPDFKKRVWSIEVALSTGPRYMADFEKMNDVARQMLLLKAGNRLITLEDARKVVGSGLLDPLNDNFNAAKTHTLTQVPSEIAIGDASSLAEYMKEEIIAQNVLEEIAATKPSVIE
ncbi:hypothetical protein [Legionella maioricensis]|uniref:Uncharacterized protein n=1 Tax=Legionella maioricensis TaxID=2896528 RepID=A0A9X2CZJ9_9GAMM|nr:hypothetical protein [Legionella maioricensis]MCL9683612.1 hypothetical protein [Legionella maioricensis]MCL9687634.1 hypothetical protein [Legionella maioricensis]